MPHPHTFIFMGRSGSGKGVQVRLLQDWLTRQEPVCPTIYIETGNLLRQFVREEDSWTAKRAAEIMGRGGRLADFLPVSIWSRELAARLDGRDAHLIFDGVARSLNEAKTLQTALEFYERIKPTVVYLNISAAVAAARLAGRGRADDAKPENNLARQRWFDEAVAPVLDYYRQESFYRFLEINGEQSETAVHESIVRAL